VSVHPSRITSNEEDSIVDLQDETQVISKGSCIGVFEDVGRTRRMAWAGVLLPLTIFWATCLRFLSPLPVADDYDAILLFLVHLKQLPTRSAKISTILFEQHNEYKLIWGNAVTALQYKLFGHVDFIALSLLGDLQVMLLAWLLWKAFARETIQGTCRLVLFVPVAMLLFQTNYAETLNWSMAALQNLGVITFALLSLWLLQRSTVGDFAGACAALVFSIAASGNGFFLLPVGLLLLSQQQRHKRMAVWILVCFLCAVLYFHHYTFRATAAGTHNGLHPIFLLSLLGSFAGVKAPFLQYASLPAGACVLIGTAYTLTLRFYRRNATIAGFLAFVLITIIGISVTRGGSGYANSLSMRYKLYADLALICLYAAGIERMEATSLEQQRRTYRLVLAAACLFFFGQTMFGLRFMRLRLLDLNHGLALYQGSRGTEGPVPVSAKGTQEETKATLAFNEHFRKVLWDASAANIYHLPRTAAPTSPTTAN
jgi:hypothetical protein